MVEEISVEQIQEISEIGSRKEGIRRLGFTNKEEKWIEHFEIPGSPENFKTAKKAFEQLWTEINGRESWQENPWVWVVKFRVLSRQEKPSLQEIEWNYNQIIYFSPKQKTTG
jgi:hypothetical protein